MISRACIILPRVARAVILPANPPTPPVTARVSHSRAIAAFSIGSLFYALAFVQRVAPSVMTSELMRDFAAGGAALGTLSAWYFYAYAGIQLPVGVLNDRFGPRRLMSAALVVCALASAGFAFSDSLFAASVFRALIGASVAFAFVGTLTIAGYWFAPSRFAMLAGAVLTVGMLGAMLGQAPLRHAVEGFGWRAAVLVMGAAALLLALLVWYVVPPRRGADAAPQSAPPGSAHGSVLAGTIAVAANPQTWACAGAGFGMTAIMLAFSGLWAVPWLRDVHDYSTPAAAAVASLLFFGWALGAPLMGWLSDYSGRRKPVLLAGVLCNTALFAALLFSGLRAPAALSAVFFLLGVSGSMMTVVFGSMREVNSSAHASTAMGLLNMFVIGSGAVMQPLIGWLLDANWDGGLLDGARIYAPENYTAAFSVLFASNLLALVCVLILRETYCKAPEDS